MLFCKTNKDSKTIFGYLIYAMVKKNGKIGLHGGGKKKIEKLCPVFGFRPSVSFCSASAKNFHFGASEVLLG